MVYRIFVEKKPGLDHEAKKLLGDIRGLLQIESVTDVRLLNRYDVENIEKDLFDYAEHTVFAEPQLDVVTADFEEKKDGEEPAGGFLRRVSGPEQIYLLRLRGKEAGL